MVREVYYLEVMKIDHEYGEIHLSTKEYENYPTPNEIAEEIKISQGGETAKVEKRYVLTLDERVGI